MIKVRLLKTALLALLISAGLSSCKEKVQAPKNLVQPVKIFKISDNGNTSSVKVFTGVVKESREVKLAFQVPGPLVNLYVAEGQYVKRGQLIAKLDDRDYQVQLESAKANYENAKLQAERYASLYEKKSTSKSVYDQTQAGFKLAKAQKEAAENALLDTKIYAPFTGYIQSLYAENFEKVGAGQPIVSLLDLNNLEISVALSENDFINSNQFTDFSCQFENVKNKAFDLKLIDIEKKPNRDNFYKMRLRLDTSDKTIVPGMVASISVALKSDNNKNVKVPVESVFSEKGKSFVWVFDPAKKSVKKCQVTLIEFDSHGMIKLENNLKRGEFIVAAGVHSLREGQKVKILKNKSNTNVGGQL